MAALVQGSPVVIEEKHPAAVKRLAIDWVAFADSSTITSSSWVDASPAAGIVLSNDQVDGLKTGVMVSGGTIGQTAYVENRVGFSDGRVEVITFCLPVTTKAPAA